MQDIYRMMEERSSREFAPEGEFDKQAWAERKQSERQEAFDRADAAAPGMAHGAQFAVAPTPPRCARIRIQRRWRRTCGWRRSCPTIPPRTSCS